MKIVAFLLSSLVMLFLGCGGGKNTSSIDNKIPLKESSIENLSTAKDNLLRDVDKLFGVYRIKVYTDETLDEDAVSNDTVAVYGEVDGKNTAALLKLNSNYPIGTKIIVKVFASDTSKFLVESEMVVYNGSVVNFGMLDTK